MTTKSNLGVEVGDSDTELIQSTETSTSDDRVFGVGNRENEITAIAWGSDDNQNWDEEESKTLQPGDYETLKVSITHKPYVKLTGKTTSSGQKSTVDAYLTYPEP